MAGAKGRMDDVDFEKQEAALLARAEKFRAKCNQAQTNSKIKVTNQVVDVFSDGTRMSATIWKPKGIKPGKKLPAILLCHGWGGKRGHLDFSYAPAFASAGFICLTFDYRTWGDSDGILIAAEKQPKVSKGNEVVTIKARIVRKVIDPEWQLRDIDSALNYLVSVEDVDISRIGIWGSSFGGGHSLAVGSRDDRIKCIVCQIGSIDTHANWINRHPQFKGATAIRKLATSQAKNELQPWTIQMPIGLDGAPNLPKVVFEHTSNTIAKVHNIQVPTLILAAKEEELFKNENNSELVFQMLKGKVPTAIEYLPGGHYDAYGQPAYGKGVESALHWFQLYIGNSSTSKL